VLDEVAPQVVGKLAIGTIDCTTEKALCKEYKVKSYPTLKFYKDGTFFEYPGGRKAKDILDFAEKMSQPPVTIITDYQTLLTTLETTKSDVPVGFLYYNPKDTSDENDNLLESVFTQVARKLQASAEFFKLKNLEDAQIPSDWKESNARIVRLEPGAKPVVYQPAEKPASAEFLQFVKEQNVALMTVFGPSNFHKVGNLGRPLVIGCVKDESRDEIVQKLKDYVLNIGPAVLVNQYYFGSVDGTKWSRFLQQFGIATDMLPQYLVLDVPTKRYYHNETYNDVKSLLEAIDNGDVTAQDPSKNKPWWSIFERLMLIIVSNLPWSLIPIAVLAVVIVLLVLGPAEELRPPYDKEPTVVPKTKDEAVPAQEEETKKDQ